MSIVFQPEYGYVLVSASSIAMHCFAQGMIAGGIRSKLNIEYPDCGNGRLSKDLSDAQWNKFQCAQRAHNNYLEALPMILVNLLIAGINFPYYSVCAAAGVLVGRQLYCTGYRNNGPSGRIVGARIGGLSGISLFFVAIASGLKVAQVW